MEWAKKNWLSLILLTGLAFGANLYFYEEWYLPLSYIHKMLCCCCFIYWLWRFERYIPKFVGVLAELSFGIYFVHYYVLLAIRGFYTKLTGHQVYGSALNWTLCLIIGVAGSILIIKIIQKLIPKYSRNIIGV